MFMAKTFLEEGVWKLFQQEKQESNSKQQRQPGDQRPGLPPPPPGPSQKGLQPPPGLPPPQTPTGSDDNDTGAIFRHKSELT